jgi:hypothetical protein
MYIGHDRKYKRKMRNKKCFYWMSKSNAHATPGLPARFRIYRAEIVKETEQRVTILINVGGGKTILKVVNRSSIEVNGKWLANDVSYRQGTPAELRAGGVAVMCE